MILKITGKNNLVLTDALKNAIKRNLEPLNKYFEEDTNVNVVLSVIKNDQIVEITIPYKGVIFRAEAITPDMYSTLDVAVDKIKKQISKYKTKWDKKINAKTVNNADIMGKEDNENDEDEEFKIVRTKRFAFKPMSPQEAILQMNLLGHAFFVFNNMESNEINVVYRRRDGSYGLIEPENA